MNKFVSSKHLEAVSDLTLSAPIKQGFVPAFESVTYETRLQLLLKTLFKVRSTAREHSKIKPFVDTAERIQSLLDFRLAVIDTEPKHLLLSATFDRPFEPYMRLIWDPLGPLLDVIFCNCEGYVTATGHSFEEYLAWVRKSQIDSDFFYSMGNHSVSDVKYLLEIEKLQRERNARTGTAITAPDPEAEAEDDRHKATEPSAFLGMEALIALYRLTDFYPPDDPEGEGELLRKAAQQLLRGWQEIFEPTKWAHLVKDQWEWFAKGNRIVADVVKERQERVSSNRLTFREEDIQGGIVDDYGHTLDKGEQAQDSPRKRRVRHGALLLMRVTDADKARAFIGDLKVTDGTKRPAWPRKDTFLNLAFTWRGLVNLGLPQAELDRFPQEFREGMEDRAGLIGDLRANHPRRWLTPLRNWPEPARPGSPRIDLSEVDLVIQLRTTRAVIGGAPVTDIHDERHPLRRIVCLLDKKGRDSGVELVAVETMRRAFPDSECSGTDHFGFIDGLSQPVPVDIKTSGKRDEVNRGEVLWGYVNDRSDPPPAPSTFLDNGTFLVVRKLRQHPDRLRKLVNEANADLGGTNETLDDIYGKLVGRRRDGSVMVCPPGGLGNAFDYEEDDKGEQCPFQAHIRRANPRAKPEGETMRPTPRILRRGLSYGPPSVPVEAETEAEAETEVEVERGVVFMAYCASIAEQYEVIQRWIHGGNSTRIGSWLTDPLMGVPDPKRPSKFRFRYQLPTGAPPSGLAEGAIGTDESGRHWETIRIKFEQPFVELQWGSYLFVPSMPAIRAIAQLSPVQREQEQARHQDAEVRRGQRIIARLQALAATGPEGRRSAALGWKSCLEDFYSKDPAERAEGPAVWAAIRACHGGVLRVPYGLAGPGETVPDVVLVASKELVMRVFRNNDGNYSMCGQMGRMEQSFGRIFLGLDKGEEYDAKAAIKDPIYRIPEPIPFQVAYDSAAKWLEVVFQNFERAAFPPDAPNDVGIWGEFDLRRDFITPVLGIICNQWFGIPDTLPSDQKSPAPDPDPVKDHCKPPHNHVDFGGWSFEATRKPRCPGDFLATSRYCFYPDPVPRVQAYGKAHGRRLRSAVRMHFEKHKAPQAAIAKLMAGIPVYDQNRDEFARTLIGVMTGFLPPTDASLRWTLYEWLEEKLFWRLQQDFLKATPPAASPEALAALQAAANKLGFPAGSIPPDAIDAYGKAKVVLEEPLKRAMQKRPSPDMLWRTSVRRHKLGSERIEDGDRIFIGIVSAMAEDADAGVSDVYPVFGGRHDPKSESAPLHACPAYNFAMGTMMGILAALMAKVRVEALPAPLLVRVKSLEPGANPLPGQPSPAPAANGNGGSPPVHEESSGS